MGKVYRATDLTLGQVVAHPNVCRVYDIGQVDGLHYISMEYVDGEDLGSLLRRTKKACCTAT